MIVSKEWLNDYIDISLDDDAIESNLTALGLECTLNKDNCSFQNVYVGYIVDCYKHPNADKLSVCSVDVGSKQNLNIVCGAPNVKIGIKVPVAIINASLNSGEFKIRQTKIRGVESQGMICSEKELGLSEKHEGIMILDDSKEVGSSIEDILFKNKDVIFELDLTPNRGDCFSHLGTAREIAIIEKTKIKDKAYNFTENSNFDDYAAINIASKGACLRYSSRIIKGVRVKESPKWLKDRLNSIGQKPINNIVDAANYIMMDTGHPLHTFDVKKIKNKKITVRFADKNEKIDLLDGNTYNLDKINLVIADSDKPIAIAGVMGDKNTGITNKTTDILIESAYFNPSIVRKSAKYLGLSTESSKRFERDTDINNVINSLNQITDLILKIAGGESISNLKDIYPIKKESSLIEFNVEECNKFLGTNFTRKDIENYLFLLNIKINNRNMLCKIPSYRNDITRSVDLYEEIARVFGYDNIPVNNSFTSNYQSFSLDEFELQNKIKYYLMSNGCYENYSNSLVDKKDTLIFSNTNPVRISNPLSNKMEFLRTSLIPGLLKAASYNIKRNLNNFKLFESGVIHKYVKDIDRKSVESNFISIIYVGGKIEHWRNRDGIDFYSIKGEINSLFKFLRFKKIEFMDSKSIGFSKSFLIKIDNVKIGLWGIIDKNILKSYKINSEIYGFEIDYSKINKLYAKNKLVFKSPNKFPIITRDIAIEVDLDIKSKNIVKTIVDNGGNYLKDISLFDVYKGDKIDKNKISLAYSIKFQAKDKTLTDKEIDKVIDTIIKRIVEKHNAKQR